MTPTTRSEAGTATGPPGESHPAATDADLIARSLADREAFAQLYDRHATALHRFAARRLGNVPAEDPVAETFLVAFRLRARYDLDRPDARPWLLGILTREIGRRRRQEAARYRLLEAVPPPGHSDGPADLVAGAVSARAVRADLARALGRLKPADRDVLLLVAWADLTYPEVAAALQVPVGTVRSRLHRARRIMRAELGHLMDLEELL